MSEPTASQTKPRPLPLTADNLRKLSQVIDQIDRLGIQKEDQAAFTKQFGPDGHNVLMQKWLNSRDDPLLVWLGRCVLASTKKQQGAAETRS